MKISIITVNLNNKKGLEKTILSVIEQTYSEIEFIIIDGGSTDGSINVLKQNDPKINYWISETDKGVYDAMNKGILKSTGDYLLMLNSGDYLANESIIENIFKSERKESIIYGNLIWDTNGNQRKHYFPEKLSLYYFTSNSIGHQATFIKKELHNKLGLYDLDFKITADWKFFIIALFKHNVDIIHVKDFVSVCDRGGISCAPDNWDIILNERSALLKSDFTNLENDVCLIKEHMEELDTLKKNLIFRIIKKLNLL